MTLNTEHQEWFTSRGIDPETASMAHVKSRAEGVVFPYLEHGEDVNEKVRRSDKTFRQRKGGRKTFWNSDILDDPTIRDKGGAKVIITEGEMDALTAIECGFSHAMSVPDGAPAKPTDSDQKFGYVDNNQARLDLVKGFIIAADGDQPGRYLAEELVRRLGADRCYFVTYPKDTKDLNDVLMKYGKAEVVKTINNAKPYPIRGLHRLSDFPDLEPFPKFSTGWDEVDPYYNFVPGTLTVVTGVPGDGKSTFVTAASLNACKKHGWKALTGSFENPPTPYHRDVMRSYLLEKHLSVARPDEIEEVDAWLDENMLILGAAPDDDEQEFTYRDVIEIGEMAVVRHGIRMMIVDPWNQIEQTRFHGETETEYTARALKAFRSFARSYNVAVIIVAHPAKMSRQDKKQPPGLYDIAGSANWANAPDFGITIYRQDRTKNDMSMMVRKARFRGTGKPGYVPFIFTESTGRYVVDNSREDSCDY